MDVNIKTPKVSPNAVLTSGVHSNSTLEIFNDYLSAKNYKLSSLFSPVYIDHCKFSGEDSNWIIFQRDHEYQSLKKIFPPENLIP